MTYSEAKEKLAETEAKIPALEAHLARCVAAVEAAKKAEEEQGEIQAKLARTEAALSDLTALDQLQKSLALATKEQDARRAECAEIAAKIEAAKKANIELTKQIALAKEELEYIGTVFDALSKAETESDLNEIRDELYHSGYASKMKNYTASKQNVSKPLKFMTSGGYTLFCGKKNCL